MRKWIAFLTAMLCMMMPFAPALAQPQEDVCAVALVPAAADVDLGSLGITEEDLETVVHELKMALEEIANMSDAEVEQVIRGIFSQTGVRLPDFYVTGIIKLLRSMGDMTEQELLDGIKNILGTAAKVQQATQRTGNILQAIANFCESVYNFFVRIFS